MSVLPILRIGEEALATKCEPVSQVDDDLVTLVDDMVETCYMAPGVGLAANQVGVCKQLAILDLSVGERPEELKVLINPTVIASEGQVREEEGCLSIPGLTEVVTRPAWVKVQYLDRREEERVLEAEGLMARALCHEIDHLNGVLFVERLSALKRKLLGNRLREIREGE